MFGPQSYPVRSYDAGIKLSDESAQQDADALEQGGRIKNLKVNYGEIAWDALVVAPFGVGTGLIVWLFFRLVYFAVKG